MSLTITTTNAPMSDDGKTTYVSLHHRHGEREPDEIFIQRQDETMRSCSCCGKKNIFPERLFSLADEYGDNALFSINQEIREKRELPGQGISDCQKERIR